MGSVKCYMYVSYTIVNRLTSVRETHYIEFITRHTISRQKWKDLIDFIYEKHNPGNWDLNDLTLIKERWIK